MTGTLRVRRGLLASTADYGRSAVVPFVVIEHTEERLLDKVT